jgi:hypothetical protein
VFFGSLSNKILVIRIFAFFFAFFRPAQAAAPSRESILMRTAPGRIRASGEVRDVKPLFRNAISSGGVMRRPELMVDCAPAASVGATPRNNKDRPAI